MILKKGNGRNAVTERGKFCEMSVLQSKENTRVVDSRPVGIQILSVADVSVMPAGRFTTYEKVETIPLTVIKGSDQGTV